jgi:hypothetical protein
LVRKDKTPVLDAAEVRVLRYSIGGKSHNDLRDKALPMPRAAVNQAGALIGLRPPAHVVHASEHAGPALSWVTQQAM